jgi:glycosyltransferase involved in cell wall biosynthesis
MRILLAAPTFGVYGGIEVFVMTLAEWLQQNTAHDVRVCFKVVAGRTVTPQLERRCGELGLSYTFVRRGSLGLLAQLRWADLVHSNTCSPDIALLAKAAGKPLVLTIHNWFRGKRGVRNRVWYLCNRLANWRTYNSRFVLHTWEPDGPRADSELIPTVSHLPTVQAPIAERSGFFFIARLIENKGLDILLKAYEAADLDHAAWPLLIAGDGPLRPWAEQYVAERGLSTVQLLGFLGEAEKALRIARAKWLVAPANTKEDMGLTPIEARSVAVPSIVTRDGGLPEAAGESALLCEPGSVPELARALEIAARMPADEYERRATASRESLRSYLRPMSVYPSIYERVVSRAPAPRPDMA